MQHNYSNNCNINDQCSNYNNRCNMDNSCSNVPSNRYAECRQQPTVPHCSTTSMAHHNFPPHYVNPRFCVTPETMGISSSSAYQVNFRGERQSPSHIPPLVDVKSYYERHNEKQLGGNISVVKLDRNASFASTKSNARNSSYASIRSEHTVQNLPATMRSKASSSTMSPPPAPPPPPSTISAPAPSPPPTVPPRTSLPSPSPPITSSSSPPPPPPLPPPPSDNNCYQQWNFDNKIRQQQQQQQQQQLQQQEQQYQQQCQQQQAEQPDQMSGVSSPALLCFTQLVQPLTSAHHLASQNSPCGSTASCIARKASEDSCISASSAINEIPTSYFEKQLEKYNTGSDLPTGDSAKINYGTLNKMFLKRLQDIDDNVCGDKDLKLVTFQEWVDMLLKINDSFITNMEELEKEVAERLELVQQKVNTKCRYSQGNELMKCRKDIETLIKVIQNLYYNKTLDLCGVTFETINPAQILEKGESVEDNGVIKTNNDSEVLERNKLVANIKALAYEVAEKHDELRELKRQIFCLEEDVQKAQQKIQFKDDVIKELRNDLKSAHHKLSASTQSLEEAANLRMPPINFEHQTARSGHTQITDCNTLTFQDENSSQFDSLSHTEHEEQQKIKVLEEELNEFFEISRELNKQKMENQRKRLMDIFQTAETEKVKAYRKLDYIRRQLIDLETNNAEGAVNDGDSGFHSKSENDQDAKIIDSVRKRVRKLNETNMELKKKLQKLEMEKSELSTNLESEKTFAQRNSETLKQVADLLSGMKAEQFSYTDIYNKTSSEQSNPFCEAIIGIKKAFQEKEQQLLKVLGLRNKQIEELMNNEKCYNEERMSRMNLNDLENVFKTTTTITTSPISSLATASDLTTTNTTTNSTMSSSLTSQHVDSKVTTFHKD